MKINKSFLLGVAMIAVSVLMEIFWISTGSAALGVFSLCAALIASGALARCIRLDYRSADDRLRKFLTVTGLEN